MIAEFQCNRCGRIIEEYYPTTDNAPKLGETHSMCTCKGNMLRIFGRPIVKMGGIIPGYEPENEGHLTLGKAVDSKQKWV